MLIFYADDDSDDRELFSYVIKSVKPRIECVLFESGEDLLNFLGSGTVLPDFIFIDINMPKMNGYECVQQIRSKESLRTVKIIMYSTSFDPEEQLKSEKLGVDFMVKPNEIGFLMRYFEKLAEKNSAKQLEEKP